MDEFDELEEMTEEELEAYDEALLGLAKEIAEDECGVSIVSPLRFNQMKFVWLVAKMLTKGKNIKLSYKLNAPYTSMGSIRIEGKELMFKGSKWFGRMLEFSNNLDVYPMANGNISMVFTFHGLTVPAD